MVDTPTTPRFIDNGDNTITDNKTGLTWMKEDDGKYRSWKEAKEYCESLGDGWRMPTIDELQTLIDRSRYNPAADPILNIRSDWYWSSTPYAGDSGYAWGVFFGNGGVGWSSLLNGDGFVRPVRQNSL